MTKLKLHPKVAFDCFFEQLKWSLWFYGFLAAAHIIGIFIVKRNDANIDGFFVFSSQSTAIFMLVCGIIAAYGFMFYFVQQGITRKDMFLGVTMGAAGLAIAVTLIPLALNGVEYVLLNFTSLPIDISTASAFEVSTGWLSAAVIYLLNVYTYYLIGWFIGIGYYRFGWLIGFGFVALALVAFSVNAMFIGDSGLSGLIPWMPNFGVDANLIISFAGSLVLIAILLTTTRLLTKRIPIKM